jgi:3-hydroxybutyryl-CoA dehydrogenase
MKIKQVVVIGAGTMGSGIAQWFAQQGCRVELVDHSPEQARRALDSIHAAWDKLMAKGKLSADVKAELHTRLLVKMLPETHPQAELVIEAIIENLEIKKALLRQLDQHYSKHTIFASNTSSFPIASMADALAPERQAKFLGLHFFNPAPIMQLVEVIQGQATESTLCQQLYQWFEEQGKKPAHCKDSPGFIVNRVARNFYGEPLRIVEQDDTSKMQEVDRILREVGGFKMGPFELMDLIGIDINYSVTCSVWEAYEREPRFAPHPLQEQLVQAGRLGRKTRRGFYHYD